MDAYTVIQKLTLVLSALNNIEVKGKTNLNNLSVSIELLEEIKTILMSS